MVPSVALEPTFLLPLVANDAPAQAPLSAAAIEACEASFVPPKMALALEWDLRGACKIDQKAVVDALLELMGVRLLRIDQVVAVRAAWEHQRQGPDCSEALDQQRKGGCVGLLSFDPVCVRLARRLSVAAPVQDSHVGSVP